MQNRRTLHQPFFPLLPPPPSPLPSPSLPKYPFSSNPQQPFFPNYPSPPPPPPPPSTSDIPTFPANLSSLIYPNSPHTSSHHHSTAKLLPAILISLLLLSLLSLSTAFLFHRRRRRQHHPDPLHQPKKQQSIHPPAATSPPSSDFLYLGTLVNRTSQTTADYVTNEVTPPPVPSVAESPLRKVGSPELRPLPPLSRSVRTSYANATDSDDEFYSPKGSDNPIGTNGSGSRRDFQFQVSDDKTGSDMSSPSYPDSNSDNGSESSLRSADDDQRGSKKPRSAMPAHPPPPPPPPPPPMIRPMTPSPPKRKPPSPSPFSSPIRSARVSVRSPARSQLPMMMQSTPSPLPPPPPPPPPVGYWERQVRKRPVVVTPRSVGLKTNPMGGDHGAELVESLDSVERIEETTPRPRLKPLHWDKVRASSDRVMVWDQLKSSSFQ